MDVEKPIELLRPLVVNRKLMMGPGPSNCSPRVLHALSQPVIGHFHDRTFQIMDEIKSGLKYIFQTRNEVTIAVSATGHGGMETAFCNLIEPNDKILIAVNGIWGERAADLASRYGGIVETIKVPPGENFEISHIEKAISTSKPNLFFVVQGESSTGVYQPIERIGRICKRFDCLLIVDAVASLGGVKLFTDRWLIDCVYSGSQKVLSSPPGLSPISFGPRSLKKIRDRKRPVPVYYFDINLLGQYWGCFPGKPRIYHHTISATMLYGLRESLAEIVEEGIDNCIKRHEKSSKILYEGLKNLGFEFFVTDENARLPTVTTLSGKGLNSRGIIEHCLNRYDLEISGGLGPTAGKIIRIGLMGNNANEEMVRLTLKILEEVLNKPNAKL